MAFKTSLLASSLLRTSILLGSSVVLTACGSLKTTPTNGEKIGTVQQLYDGALTSDIQVSTYRNIDKLYPTATVKRGDKVYPLPAADRPMQNFTFTSEGKKYDLVDYMALNRVAGLLVLKDGKIAYEDYEFGNTDKTRWMSMSVVKSMTATLIGVAIKDGYIKSIDDQVTKYVPKLKGSAYDGVTLRHLLQMASAVKWNETYVDPKSDRRQMLEVQNAQKPGAVIDLMARLPRAGEPGSIWNYSTGETHVVGEVVRAATGKPVSQYLSERIWAKFGMESDASWWLESPNGLEVGGSGLSATLRDYGRFGLFALSGGIAGGEKVLPDGWMEEAGKVRQIGGKKVAYGYMWWPLDAPANSLNEGAYQARGIFGQAIYVNPKEKVVIAVWGALPKPTGSAPIKDVDFYEAVVKAVR